MPAPITPSQIIVAIPAYNERETIAKVIADILKEMVDTSATTILVVDDGSTDGTSEIARSLSNTVVISHLRNRGVGAAFHTALNFALARGADILVTIDADGQFNPADIPILTKPIENGAADFVTASRFMRSDLTPVMPGLNRFGNRAVARIVSGLTGQKFYDVSCGFRAYGREALLRLNLFGTFTYTQEVFLDLTFKDVRIAEVPAAVKYFPGRRSRVANSVWRYGWRILMIMLSTLRDYHPLKFFGLPGAAIFSLGAAIDLLLGAYFLKTGAFSPYKGFGIAALTLNLIGFGLVAMGMVLDMLARMRINQEKLLYFAKKNFQPAHKK